jgi:hypothetical protein
MLGQLEHEVVGESFLITANLLIEALCGYSIQGGKVIIPFTVKEILDEQIAHKLA